MWPGLKDIKLYDEKSELANDKPEMLSGSFKVDVLLEDCWLILVDLWLIGPIAACRITGKSIDGRPDLCF